MEDEAGAKPAAMGAADVDGVGAGAGAEWRGSGFCV